MTNSKSASNSAELNVSADVMKRSIKKGTEVFQTAADLGKGNIEAYVESATIAGEGMRTINTEISLYSKKLIEESVIVTKALLGAKSIQEAIELQTTGAKIFFGAYVGQMKLLNELFVGTAKESFAPIQRRVEALTKIARSETPA